MKTLFITNNVDDRYRGYLSSSCLEITSCVYILLARDPVISVEIWSVLNDWWKNAPNGWIMMVQASGAYEFEISTLGYIEQSLFLHEGIMLSFKENRK